MKAIVFDKSGTIVDTKRVALDVCSGDILRNISSFRMVDVMEKGALLLLERSVAEEIFLSDDDISFSDFCNNYNVCLKCIYENTDDYFSLEHAITSCNDVPIHYFKKTINKIFEDVGKVRTNNGIVYDICNNRPTHVLSTGGYVINGVPDLFDSLRRDGWDIFIATGDTYEGMKIVGKELCIDENNMFCFQNEPKKAQSIRLLKRKYDEVIMVGNDSNDMAAFIEADSSILVTQDGHEKKPELFDVVDHVVQSITDILDLL